METNPTEQTAEQYIAKLERQVEELRGECGKLIRRVKAIKRDRDRWKLLVIKDD